MKILKLVDQMIGAQESIFLKINQNVHEDHTSFVTY